MNLSLRPYQQEAVAGIRDRFRSGHKNVLLVSPTGSGKTTIFSHITESAASRGNRVMILVHRAELLRQSSEQLREIGVAHGCIAPGIVPDPYAPVQVASVQTLVNRLGRYEPPALVIADEAHHVTRKTTWGKILTAYPSARVLGVTATPVRLSGEGLGRTADGLFDAMVHGPTVADLIRDGYLSRPQVYCPPVGADLSGLRTRAGEFQKDQLAEIMDKPTITGCAIDHYRRICQGAPAIAFCASVAHADHLAEQFRQAGYSAASIDGKLEHQERKQRIADLGAGRLSVLTSCDVISEGTDIPRVVAAIMLRPTASLGLYLQQAGRVLRPFPGKTHSVILDHVCNTYRHGFVDDPREWTLDATRKGSVSQKEREVSIRQCHACYACHEPAPVCPYCGFEYPVQAREVEEVAGTLEAASREHIEAMREMEAQRRDRKREEGQCQTLEDWQRLAKERGYAPGWGYYRWKARSEGGKAA